ncbi:hypothetical protein IJG93_00515 [Candidatus Saccharibacteria bacterium]|nr:hypothetical protein [Candidatus Saccharibacteria bacterium]
MVMLKSKAFLRTCVFLVAVFVGGMVSASVGWALNLKSGEAAHYAENSIYFYDPDDCLIRRGSSGDGDGPLTGGTRAEKVWNYIVDLGISGISDTPEVIAGIMGNMQQESGFNPFVQNDGGCTGLIQWCGMNSYNSAFRDYMKNKGLSGYYFHRGSDPGISESIIEEGIKAELDYLFTRHSNTNNFKSKLNVPTSKTGTNGARAYADLFLVIVERAVGGSDTIEDEGVKSVASSTRYQDAEKRRDFAENLYAQFSGNTGGGGGGGGGDSEDDVNFCEEDD